MSETFDDAAARKHGRRYDTANAHALAEEQSDDSQQRVVGGRS